MATLITWVVLIFPWVIALIPDIHDPFRPSKEMFFDIACMSIITLGLWRGLNFRHWNRYLSVFVGWVFFTIIVNWYLPIVLATSKGCVWNLWTIQPTLHFILAVIATMVILSTIDKDGYQKIAKAICWSSVAVSVIGILQLLGFDIFGKLVKDRLLINNNFYAMLDNPNIMGNYFALSLPFFFPFLKSNKYKGGFLICLTGLILSRSYLAIGCGLIGIIIYLIIKLRKKRIFLASLILTALILSATGASLVSQRVQKDGIDGRLKCWEQGVNELRSNPVFGRGLGIFKTLRVIPVKENATVWESAHNDYLEGAIQIGILGIFLFLFVIIHSIRNFDYGGNNICYFASFIVFLLLMIGSFPVETPVLAFIGLLNYCAVEKS